MALDHFARAGVDFAVIETGLGGRLDATNVLQPVLTITTDISYDHVEILGDTLEKIAGEKAGIIKSGTPHLIGFLPKEGERVMRTMCRERRSPLVRLMKKEVRFDRSGDKLDFADERFTFRRLSPPLMGIHQQLNCAVTLKALSVLKAVGLRVTRRGILRGLPKTYWPGRFQVIARNGHPMMVLDVAHNAAGVAGFVRSFSARFPNRRCRALVGFVKRKEHQKMFDSLSEIVSDYTLVRLATHRTIDVREMISAIDWRGLPVQRAGSVISGYRRLVKSSGPDDILIGIGSHYLVGELLALMKL